MTTILDTAQVTADYAAVFARRGEDVLIRRHSGTPGSRTAVNTAARARPSGFAPSELAGGVVQGDRKLIVLVDAAVTAILPVTTADKIVVRGKELAIKSVDDNTRRIGTTCFALEIVVGG